MFNTMRIVIGACCVVAALFTTTACMADPPPPQVADWKEDLTYQGRALGFEDPHVTDESQQLKMFRAGCTLYLTQLADGTQIATLFNSHTSASERFETVPDREKIEVALARLDCSDK